VNDMLLLYGILIFIICSGSIFFIHRNIFGEKHKSKRQPKKIPHERQFKEMYKKSCDRHEADLYLWLTMDKSKKHLNELEKEMKDCGVCGL